jgi:tetratricopeptide (TPR) repeat protein
VSYEENGEFDFAIDDYRKALEINPNNEQVKQQLESVLKKRTQIKDLE